MSGFRTHVIVYVAAAGVLTYLLLKAGYVMEVFDVIPAFVIGFIYSMLPDIDVPASKAREYTSKILLAALVLCLIAFILAQRIVLIYMSIGLTGFLYLLWFTRHRGIFHTIYAGLVFSLPLYIINPAYVVYALLGFGSHLLADGKLL